MVFMPGPLIEIIPMMLGFGSLRRFVLPVHLRAALPGSSTRAGALRHEGISHWLDISECAARVGVSHAGTPEDLMK
jgi:hypothetical protein